ncbi:MAG TPA: glycoside hydrolase family 1 protein [Thermoproteales archaeon]|nr:glycoside hydrolase family 1 protein [Thermoproteales archaeon]
MSNLIIAHARAYEQLKKWDRKKADKDSLYPAHVGVIHNIIPIQPLNPEQDKIAAEFHNNLHNTLYLNALKEGVIDFKTGKKVLVKHVSGKLDWLGVNYYTRLVVRARKSILARLFAGLPVIPVQVKGYGFYCDPGSKSLDGKPVSDFGWEVYPEDFKKALELALNYKVPIIVTENGIADAKDVLRPNYIKEHLKVLEEIVEGNKSIIGYLHWALTDNYEWAHGFKMKFGLCEVDLKSKKRKRRPSSIVFEKIVKENEI